MHIVTLVCTVCAVPELALLLVSGVLECWKHLTGRFNIQLTGSQTSYITAETPPTPSKPPASCHHPYILASSPSAAPPIGVISPSHSTLLSFPLLLCSVFVWARRGRTDSSAVLSVYQSSCWLHLIWMDCFSFRVYCLPCPQPPTLPPYIPCLWFGILLLRW